MGDVENDVAVLNDWKEQHGADHKDIWKKFDEQAAQNITFIRAIEQLQTKLTIYVAVAVVIGSVLGQMVTKFIAVGGK